MDAVKILKYFQAREASIVELIREIVDIESPSHNAEQSRIVADWVEKQARSTGVDVSIDRITVDDGDHLLIRAFPNDGKHTLLLGHTGTLSINPSLYARLDIDPRRDFAPIGLIASMPVALLAHPSFAAGTLAEFIELARKEPGKLNLGTSAVGTGGYMCAELFKGRSRH